LGTVTLFISSGGNIIFKSTDIVKEVQAKEGMDDSKTAVENTKTSTETTETSTDNLIKEVSVKGVEHLSVKSASAEITIIPEKRDNVKAELDTDSSKNVELKADLSGNKLSIEVLSKATVGINLSFSNMKLYVYIPEDYSKDLEINSVSGKIEAEKLSIKEFVCRNTSGSVNLKDISADKFDYSNTSGALKADNLITKEANVKAVSGSMDIDGFTGDITGSETSGTIDITYKTFKNDVQLNSVSGSIKLRLPENSGFALDARSTSGSINSDFGITIEGEVDKNKKIGYVKNKDNKINIKTVSGSIKIEK
jgi:lia operon protein LiaG